MSSSIVLLFLLFLVILFTGIPVAYGMGVWTIISFAVLGGDYSVIPQKLFNGIDSYSYVCVLLFILTAEIMSNGEITKDIVEFCESLVGHIRGGLAHVNVLASMLFAGLSGSAAADASGLGPIEIEIMRKGGYQKDFSCAVTAASAIIGPIIPPSTIMIVFVGCVGQVSIAKMFLGGIGPGILLGIAYMILCYVYALKNDIPLSSEGFSWKRVEKALIHTLPALILPLLIMGSIVLGICTAVESSAIAATYAIVVAICRKKLTLKQFFRCCIRSAKSAANVMLIIAIASAMGWAITTLQVAKIFTEFCLAFITSKWGFLLLMNILLLIIGMFLDASPALLVMVPILYPVALKYGINVVHFGVVVCFNLMVGTLTPPVGMMLFIISNVGKIELSVLYKKIVPFVAVAIVVLLLITYVPVTVTLLPTLLG